MGKYKYKNEVGTYLLLTTPSEFPPPRSVSVPTPSLDQGADTFYLQSPSLEENQSEPSTSWPRQWPKRKFTIVTDGGTHDVECDKILFQDGWVIFADGYQNEPRRNILAYPASRVRWIREEPGDQ